MLTFPGAKKPQLPVLCVAAGKSGGHLIPALELARIWQHSHKDGKVILCTYGTNLDQTIYTQYPFITEVKQFTFTTFVAKKIWLYPIIAFQAARAFFSSLFFLKKRQVSEVISTGGFIALPVCTAAWCLRIPSKLYELNVHAGKAIKVLSLIATEMFVVFKGSLKEFKHATLVDYPIRFISDTHKSQDEILNVLVKKFTSSIPLNSERKTLFVLGGSQGSTYLNELILKIVKTSQELQHSVQIIHQTGSTSKNFAHEYEKLKIPHAVFSFDQEIALCYQAADLILCRAGAGTIFELKYFKAPAIIIPLMAASTSHQKANALAIVKDNPNLFSQITQQQITADFQAFLTLIKTKFIREKNAQ